MTSGLGDGGELIDDVVDLVRRKIEPGRVPEAETFVRHFFAGVLPRDLQDREASDLYGAAMASWNLARTRQRGTPNLRVSNPDLEQHGWSSTHTVVQIVTDDMPFLVDSVTMELSRHDLGIHLIVHPMMDVHRDDRGHLLDVEGQAGRDEGHELREAFLHVEIDHQTRPEVLDEVRARLTDVLADVRAAVDDWPAMRARLWEIHEQLGEAPQPVEAEALAEARSFLAWLDDDHFTFLGYRSYDLEERAEGDIIVAQPETGLGILRGAAPSEKNLADQPPEVRELARARTLLNLTKANSRATVHRPSSLDYVGIKRFGPAGEVLGEWRFVGLYTSRIYSSRPHDIPVVRRKIATVLERADLPADTHDAKDLTAILESLPRDELFESSADELYDLAFGILGLQERRQVRLFVRRDRFGRYLSCLVFLPRDRYTTESRLKIQDVLVDAYDAGGLEHSVRLSESVLARLHFLVRVAPGQRDHPDVEEVERRLARAVRTWQDDLADALVDAHGEGRARQLEVHYRDAFPAAYREEHDARLAVVDLERLRSLDPGGDLAMSLYRPVEAPDDRVHLKLYRSGAPITLSAVLPLLENMGCEVIDQRPYSIQPVDGPQVWIHDLGLSSPPPGPLDSTHRSAAFQDAFARVWSGDSEDDGFNRLVLRAALSWREVTLLRAYSRYLRQASTRFSQAYMEDALVDNPEVTRLLVELFHARFDPSASEREHDTLPARIDAIESALDAVTSLDVDRILRSFLHLITATLRTSHFQTDADGGPRPCLSFKFDPSQIPDLPRPRPAFEIFVYAPRVEGVHLRGGAVARGGLRWSDRREDFRTEVLGLAKAQTVKNAVIVPVGAKGGFVVKTPPSVAGGRDALREEVEACYRIFIGGLLDVTDNIVDGQVVPPSDIVRFDGDDPYLVVAADKGTATFSDTANAISHERGFWLGDAFASGGSAGYDHKAMGITARGAWRSVQRHFRELGVDTQTAPFTVVGIGDMSGDVFGNGMLLSRTIRLVAAFDHRHIFIDPDPDPETSFEERQRLFDLARSTWDSYDRDLISDGGGVWPRTAKSVPLSAQVRRLLEVDAESLTPDELVSALLRAPVDLLFNGGVGTFVKASDETHAEVGDKTSDRVRVDASELRCKVVGEGGNLGFTGRARVEYALDGGRINTDAIDNSAGVDCSDHEVNIKIVLDACVRAGDLTRKQRDELLVAMTDEVAELVLADNDAQTEAISSSVANAGAMVEVHRRYLHHLEQGGQVDRELESLPSDEQLVERRNEGDGLVRPEFAVLLAYTKTLLYDELLASDLPEDPWLERELSRYFPSALRERYADRITAHRLRREIVATQVANALVNQAGTTFLFRLAEETGASVTDIVRAHTVAREVFDLRGLVDEVHSLDHRVPAAVQLEMLLEARRLVERGTRWLLRNLRRPLDITATVASFAEDAAVVTELLPASLRGVDREAADVRRTELEERGVIGDLAARVACLPSRFFVLDLVTVLHGSDDSDAAAVTGIYFTLAERLHLDWLREQISALPRETRWDTLARDALREDFFSQHSRLTAEVVRQTETGDDPPDRVDGWLRRNAAQVRRCEQMLAEIQATKTTDLARLSVALREIRNLRTAAT
ncbi:NAD-glutamate dehydrogenase [Nitriliruptor alkaliphilus]|uniref:NAD-glutamate dehydrogenase n=1 Tax=Nitriliruptor alkaliphilus TaxID=427918 RepID=UPI0006970E53|nr:NAD-glutamate dehydrogenase [Nitriliruptor alkaliphilus]